MKKMFRREVNRIAEVHFYLRPLLSSSLRKQLINPDVKTIVGGYENYYDFWHGSYNDRFFDMTTMIRLGTVVENCLKYYYMTRKGHKNLIDLKADPNYKKNIFQRIQNYQSDGALKIYRDALGYELTSNPHLKSMQEAMMHRHFYAHNAGLLDDEYIDNIKKITGADLTADPNIAVSYPHQDTYWFEPLKNLKFFIEEARRFFAQFP
ncbi:MAG: hypothetical protein JETT_0298 [Candidatus Jettenia ecosi]|uniref:Uncharacterized protein n=1 Tax=Candidatus Jettenia ecosi TaxID=2494326 RepID=A0A533QS83_9BACT|nr:MAG: hypothetical protein JETT_0298 [Candidatus Jettenia ecosi]